MKWNELSLKDKAELMKLYVSNGITNLDDIITHYNAYQEGGKITFEQWKQKMQQLYPDIEMDNNKAGYDYNAYFNNNYNAAIAQLTNLQHFPDTYKLPNHPTFSNESIYHNYPTGNIGGKWIYSKPWETRWGGNDAFIPSEANYRNHPEIYNEYRKYTEDEIYSYQKGGNLGKVTPYGQWEYPHEVTTIPSNNITMKGVDYPVIGVSDTGDTKYMLPNMDYTFNGNYVTEYPINYQNGGHVYQRGTNGIGVEDGTYYPISNTEPLEHEGELKYNDLHAPSISLKPIKVTAEHPIRKWDKTISLNDPSFNQLYQHYLNREEAGKTYLKSIANIGSVMSLPIGGAAGFFLNLPDAVLDITSEYPIAEELLDAPTRALAEIDNGKIGDKVEKGLYSVPKVGKIIGPAYTLWRKVNDVVQPLGATNDATDLFTGESGIEKILK